VKILRGVLVQKEFVIEQWAELKNQIFLINSARPVL
jgi:hypothetical protein